MTIANRSFSDLTAANETPRPTRDEALKAVETLIRWIGDDPARSDLVETPERVIKSFDEFFAGYKVDPVDELHKTFEDIKGYHDMVVQTNIRFVSHCEHHMVPVIGKAHVAYIPDEKVVGISKLARVVEVVAKRLTSQERMVQDIANALEDGVRPRGVAICIEAEHQCMTTRGVKQAHTSTITFAYRGSFENDTAQRLRFEQMVFRSAS